VQPADPERIGAYRILRRLGQGGMAVAYLAARDLLHASLVIRGGDFDPPSRVNPDVARKLDRITMAALRVDPERRTPTAGELADSLFAFLAATAPGLGVRRCGRPAAPLLPRAGLRLTGWTRHAPDLTVGPASAPFVLPDATPRPPRR